MVYSKLSKFPPVSRDLALLVKSDVKFADIERIARSTEKKLLKSVELFDVYEGKNIGEGMKSYAVNFILEDSEKTLTDERTDKVMKKYNEQPCTRNRSTTKIKHSNIKTQKFQTNGKSI